MNKRDHASVGKRILCGALCAFLLAAAVPAGGVVLSAEETVDDLNDQKAALQQRQEELERKREQSAQNLQEQENQRDLLQQQIDVKSQQIAVNQQLVTTLEGQIAEKTTAIDTAQQQIASLNTQIDVQFQALRTRLRAVSQGASMFRSVQTLLSSETYIEFLMGEKLIELISQSDQHLMDTLESNIQTVREAETRLQNDRDVLEDRHTQAESLRLETEEDKEELKTLYAEADSMVHTLSGEVEGYDDSIAQLQAQQAEMQSKIDDVMAQIAAREEEERRRAEEEAKRKEEEQQQNPPDDGSDGDNGSDDESEDGDTGEEDDAGDQGEENGGTYTPPTFQSGSMMWPAPTCKVITSSFKSRWGRQHYGVDIACYGDAEGEPICAAADGTVVYVNKFDTWGGGYGLHVMIDHGYDDSGRRVLTVYGHASEITAYEGMEVQAGDRIGSIGNTGNSYGAHLHFEVRLDGTAVDPVANGYISTDGIDVLG